MQAALDKVRNRANELRVELGSRLQPVLQHLLVSTSSILRGLIETMNFVRDYKSEIIALGISVTSYLVVVKTHYLWINRITLGQLLLNKATAASNLAYKLLYPVLATARLGVVALVNAFQYLTNGLAVNQAMQTRWRGAMDKMSYTSW